MSRTVSRTVTHARIAASFAAGTPAVRDALCADSGPCAGAHFTHTSRTCTHRLPAQPPTRVRQARAEPLVPAMRGATASVGARARQFSPGVGSPVPGSVRNQAPRP